MSVDGPGARRGGAPALMPSPRLVTGPLDALELALAAHVAALQRDDPLRPVVILTAETLLRAYLRRRLAEAPSHRVKTSRAPDRPGDRGLPESAAFSPRTLGRG